jgi:putative tryptophan/tyrosine transport system substrate-binding protein
MALRGIRCAAKSRTLSDHSILTAHDSIPAAYPVCDFVAAGGLMSYGTDLADMFRQVGVYTGSILKGAKPAVLQSTKFEFVINL